MELDIKLITTSPTYSQANGFAEKSVAIAKNLLKKSFESKTELWAALLEYRNTPLKDVQASPNELLMSRKTRKLIPAKERLFLPQVIPNINKNILNKNHKQKLYYDKNAKFKSDYILLWFNDIKHGWLKGHIAEVCSTPR